MKNVCFSISCGQVVTTSQKTTVPILVYTHTCRCDSANSEAQRRAAVGSAMVCTAGLGVLMIPLNSLLEAAVSRLPWVVEQAVTGGVLGGVYFGVHYGCRCVCAQHGCLQYVVCVCVCVCVDHVPRCAGWCVSPCSLRLVASMHIQKGMRMHTTRHSDRKHVAGICGACSRMSGSSTGAAIISGTGHTYHRSAYTATSSSSCTFFSEKINAAQARASPTTRLRLRGGCSGVCPRVLLTRQARNKEQTPPSRWTPFTVTAPDFQVPQVLRTP